MEVSREKPKSRVDQQIDENLRRVFEDVAKEDVPDRFKQLLKQLKEKDRPE